ncbi:MAG: DNA-formamidopyrimidine glycosylase [bacterium]
MPELPEVETVVRGLRSTILNKTIARVKTNAPPASIVVSDSFKNKIFEVILKGKEVLEINRRGKNILISLSDEITLWAHLKMTGHFFYKQASEPIEKHDLVIIDFMDDKNNTHPHHLRFNDYRRFGRLRLFYNDELWEQKGLKTLGEEPLLMKADDFISLCKKTRRMIKPALLDQSFIAGIGNIYADEALYASGIHPQRITSTLSKKKLLELHSHIQRLLKKAIRLMGTSVDTYSGVNGKPGGFQKYLLAYGREGEPCSKCGTEIKREKIGSRSAHFCPRCQKI